MNSPPEANANLGCEVVTTSQGARAMRDCASGEVMHPGTGPSVEPVALYVNPSRLAKRLIADFKCSDGSRTEGTALVLLDVGLGAASNAVAAWRVSESLPKSVRRLEIVSFDNELTALEIALRPEHAANFDLTGDAYTAARTLLETGHHETERTTWRLQHGDFLRTIVEEPEASADIVFWDFYSSKTHPDLWTLAVFRALRRVCRGGSTVHTYSTATSLRAGLLLAGFAVGAGGATGTRPETTIAAVDLGDLETPLGARWLARLTRSTSKFPSDVSSDDQTQAAALDRIRACSQFR